MTEAENVPHRPPSVNCHRQFVHACRGMRLLRLPPGYPGSRPLGVLPRLEDLESRVFPAGGGANTLRAHLADAAQVSHAGGATAHGPAGDHLDAFWSHSSTAAGVNP